MLSVGTNDLKQNSVETCIDNLETLIENVKEKHKGVHLHICSVLPSNSKSSAVNNHIWSLTRGDRFIHYVKTADVMENQPDPIHPGKFAAKAIESKLNKSIKNSSYGKR